MARAWGCRLQSPEGAGEWRYPNTHTRLGFLRCTGRPRQLPGRDAQAWVAPGTEARGPAGTSTTRERAAGVMPTPDTLRERAARLILEPDTRRDRAAVVVPAPRTHAAITVARVHSPSWKQLCESLSARYSRPAKLLTSVSGADPPISAGSASVRPGRKEGVGGVGSLSVPGLPRLRSRGSEGQGHRQGVCWAWTRVDGFR